jgi:DNA-binding transcriptional LysR family regulator
LAISVLDNLDSRLLNRDNGSMNHDARYKYKDIQLPQLRSFCVAATEGNFTTAATALGLSVSGVWQQVRALERELGVTLLRRQGRNVEVTPPGRLLLELAQPHVSGLDSLARLFEARQAGMTEPLSVVATHHLLTYHLPDLVQEFVQAHPTARLNLRANRWHEILELVERGSVDLGLTPWDRDAPHRAALEYETLFEMPFLLLTAADHPLRRKKKLRPSDLVDQRLIMQTSDTCDYLALVRLLRQDNISPEQLQVVLVSHTVEMAFRYVARGVGIALAHVDPKICRSVPGVYGRVFDPQMEQLPMALVVRKNSYRSSLVEEFRTAVRKSLGNK